MVSRRENRANAYDPIQIRVPAIPALDLEATVVFRAAALLYGATPIPDLDAPLGLSATTQRVRGATSATASFSYRRAGTGQSATSPKKLAALSAGRTFSLGVLAALSAGGSGPTGRASAEAAASHYQRAPRAAEDPASPFTWAPPDGLSEDE